MILARKGIRVIIFFLLTFLSFFSGLKAEGGALAYIRLIDNIAVRAPLITLGEISSIETKDPVLKKHLINLVIEEVPRVGSSKVISSFRIKAILKREGISGVVVYGIQSTVMTETRKIFQKELKEIVLDWVQGKVDQGVEVDVEFIRLPHVWLVPYGDDLSIQIDSRGNIRLGGGVSLKVRALIGESIASSAYVRIKASYFREVPVMVRPLKRGGVLTKEYVEFRRADITRASGMEVKDGREVFSMVAKKDLRVGDLLSISDFEKPVLIERGSLNRLLVTNGAIKMSVIGAEALQHGKLGDLIIFSNPMNRKETLKARVMRKGLARIDLN